MKRFSTRETASILEATQAQVRNYARLGQIVPQRGRGRRLEFSFQDLLLLRTTKGLVDSGVPARRMRRIWSSLRRQLAAGLPLTSITIFADGRRAVAWDGHARWQPDSGQFVLNFDAEEIAERADPMVAARPGTAVQTPERPGPERRAHPAPSEAPPLTADQWFHLGCELERTSPLEARQAYHQALELDPDLAEAHLNLGRHYHEAEELGKAEAHYRDAVRCAPEDSTSHFNLGVLLEDRGRPQEAFHAYQQAIARDAEMADAHYNLGLLSESLGKRAAAIRHLMTARRLYARARRGE